MAHVKAKQFEDNVVGGAPRTSWQAAQLDRTQESCVKHMCAWKQAYASASDEKIANLKILSYFAGFRTFLSHLNLLCQKLRAQTSMAATA